MRNPAALLPDHFRVLYRQFLLRVVDVEALSMEADIPRFLGQFASVLMLISLAGTLGLLLSSRDLSSADNYLIFAYRGEHALVSGMMLVTGLVAVISWESTFPDRRDVMVLWPLPVLSRTILFAKVAASASIVGLSVLTLNFATGLAWPLYIGVHHVSSLGWLQSLAAYWFTMAAASLFVFSTCFAGGHGFVAAKEALPASVGAPATALFRCLARRLFPGTLAYKTSRTDRPTESLGAGPIAVVLVLRSVQSAQWNVARLSRMGGEARVDCTLDYRFRGRNFARFLLCEDDEEDGRGTGPCAGRSCQALDTASRKLVSDGDFVF